MRLIGVFLLLTLIAGIASYGGPTAELIKIAKIIFYVLFVVLFVLVVVKGIRNSR